MAAQFSLPFHQASHYIPAKARKRKRKEANTDSDHGHAEDLLIGAVKNGADTAYSAVLTPEERTQRRLAGQDLHQKPPSFPFPHSAEKTIKSDTDHVPFDAGDQLHLDLNHNGSATLSLRETHLAILTAVLHRSIQAQDFDRAARALSLLVRTEVHGRFLDLRHGNLWRIACELLMSNNSATTGTTEARQKFQKTRTFLEHMALQHPWSRIWPNATNVQDFKLSMFGLWIYTCCHASSQAIAQASEHYQPEEARIGAHELDIRKVELAEAKTIAGEMDDILNGIPFIDDKEMLLLRAHVALWIADLVDTISELEHDETEEPFPDGRDDWLEDATAKGPELAEELVGQAAVARQKAREIISKLGLADGDEHDLDLSDDSE